MSVQLRIRELRAPLAVPSFRSLWWAQLASELGDAVGRIALAVLVTERSGSPVAVGAVLAISVLPYLGLGQWLTAWSERFPRRRVLIVADIVRAGCYLAMATDLPLWARFALLFVASSASPPFESVRNALIPASLPDERVTDGVAVMVLTNESTRLVGLVVGGIGATLASPAAALAVNALTFVVSAMLLSRLPADEPADEVRSTVRVRDGWHAVRHDPLLRRIAWMSPAFVAFGAVPEALVVPFAEDVLNRSAAVAGALAATVSASILLVAPLVQRREGHRALVRQASLVALLGAVVSTAAFALPANAVLGFVAFAAVGPVFVSRINLGSAMLLRLPDHLRASTFSLVDGLISVGQVVAGLAGGALAEWAGVQPAFVIAMALTAASAAAAYLMPLRAHAAVRSAAKG